MRVSHCVLIPLLVVGAGCADLGRAPPAPVAAAPAPEAAPPGVAAVPAAAPPTPVPAAIPVAAPTPPANTPGVASLPPGRVAAPVVTPTAIAPKATVATVPAKPVATVPAKPAATSPAPPRAPRQQTPPATLGQAPPPNRPDATPRAAAKAVAPPLDLIALETRLKETDAIGVFTKITLKNQVDDLLDQFRAYYQGRAKTTLAELRQPFDRLLLKVLSVLQDGDPELARAILASREALWLTLADPARFATL